MRQMTRSVGTSVILEGRQGAKLSQEELSRIEPPTGERTLEQKAREAWVLELVKKTASLGLRRPNRSPGPLPAGLEDSTEHAVPSQGTPLQVTRSGVIKSLLQTLSDELIRSVIPRQEIWMRHRAGERG